VHGSGQKKDKQPQQQAQSLEEASAPIRGRIKYDLVSSA
jgi:hypothetical protein